MRAFILSLVLFGSACPVAAHHPDRESQPVHPRIDVIGPLGNNLPPSYRRRYNRPTNIGGRIAYWIAPSSQEAMAWHDAKHSSDYRCKRGRVERQYFYRKPWEALPVGPRTPSDPSETAHLPGSDSAHRVAEEQDVTHSPSSRPVVVSPVDAAAGDAAEASPVLSDTMPLTDPANRLR